MIKRGDVIQVNENGKDWCGCLMVVEEVKSWGVLAGLKVPMQGTAYLRLKNGEFEHIGKAVLVPYREESDEE